MRCSSETMAKKSRTTRAAARVARAAAHAAAHAEALADTLAAAHAPAVAANRKAPPSENDDMRKSKIPRNVAASKIEDAGEGRSDKFDGSESNMEAYKTDHSDVVEATMEVQPSPLQGDKASSSSAEDKSTIVKGSEVSEEAKNDALMTILSNQEANEGMTNEGATNEDVVKALVAVYERTNQDARWSKWTVENKIVGLACSLNVLHGISLPDGTVQAALAVLEPSSFPAASGAPSIALPAEQAFKVPYRNHDDDKAFVNHLEKQRSKYNTNHAAYFAVIQSSGYGKSRMVIKLEETSNDYRIIYCTFGSDLAFPTSNVILNPSVWKRRSRDDLESALNVAIGNLILGVENNQLQVNVTDEMDEQEMSKLYLDVGARLQHDLQNGKSTLIVFDEAAYLVENETANGVSFFRSLRRAMGTYVDAKATNLFFVVMATQSNVARLSPGRLFDPSVKPQLDSMYSLTPLDPFILGSSFRAFNDRKEILGKSIVKCHTPKEMYSMGRPLWYAILHAPQGSLTPAEVLRYAEEKLVYGIIKENQVPSLHQTLALLAPMMCLSISPMSFYTHSLVAQHMATALWVSEDRLDLVVTYPSEPVLALAAMSVIRKAKCLSKVVTSLHQLLLHGAVSKGHKGEVIVRLLNLLAMDKAPKRAQGSLEVKLSDFLKAFSRKNAEINDAFLANLYPAQGANASNEASCLDASVYFNHFVYLSEKALVTHDLLRYAYRRGAAIVAEAGRRGIDWLIPVHLGNDKFVALVGQDKNRLDDSMENLAAAGQAATHWKVQKEYFLNSEEQKSFQEAGYTLEEQQKSWPAMLFAVGVDPIGVLTADTIKKRSGCSTELSRGPCLVLTGLNYSFTDSATNSALETFRSWELPITEQKKKDIPITYGF